MLLRSSSSSGYREHCTASDWDALYICSVPYHRVEDRIRQLCAKVLAASESELHPAIADLQQALREHALYLENTINYVLVNTIKPEQRKP